MICEMEIMDETGHTHQIWDPNVEAEVEVARTTFNAMKKKGYIAYRVKPGGDKGEVMSEFDAHAGKMVLSPPLAGG